MRFADLVSAAAIVLFLGTVTPAYSQGDKQNDKQGDKQEKADKPQAKQGNGPQPQQKSAPPQAKQQQPQQKEQTKAPQQPRQGQPAAPAQAQTPQRSQESPAHGQTQQTHVQQPQQPSQQTKAQQPQPKQTQPQQSTQQRTQAQPQPQPQQTRVQQHPQRTQQQAQTWQQQKGWQQQGSWQGHATFQQDRAQHWASDHRTWAQRGGYGGSYIPQASFSLYFGSQHYFRIGALPVIYMGYPRFNYDGYSFLLVDPWPENWSDSWYAADDVYIDFDDGYYLYDRRYPGIRLAVMIAL